MVLAGQYQPAGFADWSTPEYVVISGSRNVEDIPSIERVKHAYRHTAEDGCVTFKISSTGQIEVRTFRPHVRATRESIEVPPASE